MRQAVMDIGTNTVRMLVAECVDGKCRPLYKTLCMTRLGDGLKAGEPLSDAAKIRTLDGIEHLVEEAKQRQVEEWSVVGTSAMREASDGADFACVIEEEYGFKVRIIDGLEEAKYSYAGASNGSSLLTAVVDIGGGSTEIAVGFGGDLGLAVSMPLGAIRGTRNYDMMTARGLAELKKHCFAEFSEKGSEISAIGRWIGVGGTITTIAAIMQEMAEYDPGKIQGYTMPAENVREILNALAQMSYEERLEVTGLPAERADIIVAGTAILDALMEYFALKEIFASDADLLEGLWLEAFGS